MNRLAAAVEPGRSFAQGVERARLAEELGYESVWISQVGGRDAVVVASAYAAATSRVGIGTAVLPVYPRTPVAMAQMAVTLDELSEGRFILGLGTSHRLTIEMWHGMELTRPLLTMREYVAAIRSILRGEPFAGEIYRTAFSFMGYEPPRRDLPIYISCLSPKMCRLAGEIGDGAVLWMCAPNYIRDVVVPNIEKGRAEAGKTLEGFEVVAATPVALTGDPGAGRDAFRRVAAIYWNLPFYRAAVEGGGFAEALARFDERGPEGIPDEVVDAFAGVGSLDDCRRAVESYRSAGVTLPMIGPLPSHEGSAGWESTLPALA